MCISNSHVYVESEKGEQVVSFLVVCILKTIMFKTNLSEIPMLSIAHLSRAQQSIELNQLQTVSRLRIAVLL